MKRLRLLKLFAVNYFQFRPFLLVGVSALFLFSNRLFAQNELTAVIHVHSDFSKGKFSVKQIAEIAREKEIDVVVMTDALVEHYEYGVRPFQGILKKTVERESITRRGIQSYLDALEQVNASESGVLFIDGVSATPFYYWSGSFWKNDLTLNSRGKDMLAIGLGAKESYEKLPVLGLKNSGFTAYDGDQFSAPYQKFVDATKKQGGLVFWSHPNVREKANFETPFFKKKVRLETGNYANDLTGVFGVHGFGVTPVELAEIDVPEKSLISVGRLWDRLLLEYVRGEREKPMWLMGESDYVGITYPKKKLGVLLNQIFVAEKNRAEVLQSIGQGKLYLFMPNDEQTRRVRLKRFWVQNQAGQTVSLGETLQTTSGAEILLEWNFSDGSQDLLEIELIRNGEVLKRWNGAEPGVLTFQDDSLPMGQKSYYRVIARSKKGDRLVTNPIFVAS